MSDTVATMTPTRGETFSFALTATTPTFDGTETVTCAIKKALNGSSVPPDENAAILSLAASYSAGGGGDDPSWVFTVTDTQSAALEPDNYITDAKIEFSNGTTIYADPIGIQINGRVTP